MRKLRSSFGELSYLRVWQCHRDGYPHVHLIAVFKFASLRIFSHRNRKGRMTLRVEDQAKDRFEAAWPFGFVDVLVPGSVAQVRSHVLRYIQRGMFVDDPISSPEISEEPDELVLQPHTPENPFSKPVTITGGAHSRYQRARCEKLAEELTPWNRFNEAMSRNVSMLTLFRKRSFGISREWSDRLKELQTSRLDSSPCITRRFLPLQDVRLVGFSSMVEARRAAKDPPTVESARSHPFELQTLPLGLIERPEKLPISEFQGAPIRGAPLHKPGEQLKLEDDFTEDAYDELTTKQRARLDRGALEWVMQRREERDL